MPFANAFITSPTIIVPTSTASTITVPTIHPPTITPPVTGLLSGLPVITSSIEEPLTTTHNQLGTVETESTANRTVQSVPTDNAVDDLLMDLTNDDNKDEGAALPSYRKNWEKTA